MLTGAYVAGDSWLHRAPVWLKMLALVVATGVLTLWVNPWFYLAATAAVMLAFVTAGLGLRRLWEQLWLLRWFMALFIPLQFWQNGWHGLMQYVWAILIAIGGASLVTLTTRTTDMLDTFVRLLRPLRFVGVNPDVVGLTMSLSLRQIPVMAGMVGQVREAATARGMGRSVRAVASPILTRTVRHAQNVGEALAARGVDD